MCRESGQNGIMFPRKRIKTAVFLHPSLFSLYRCSMLFVVDKDICIFIYDCLCNIASGFQTAGSSYKASEDEGDLNVDGDDTEQYGQPQYPWQLFC